MRGAIVGFGAIAMGHMYGYSQIDDLSIVAVVDTSHTRRSYAEQNFNLRAYSDFAALLEREQIDFIDVCATNNTHEEYMNLALSHHLNVLCEKPVFLPTRDGYASFMRRIWASGKVVYPCHVYKFAPVLNYMQDIISSPEFGDVLSVQFRTLRRGHALGVAEWNPNWRRDPAISSGGILRDHGPHNIYLAMHLTNRIPVAVSCLIGNMSKNEYTSTEDTALVRIRCNDGLPIVLTLSWSASYRNTCYTVIGSAGTVVVEDDTAYHTKSGRVVRSTSVSGLDDPSHAAWFRGMLEDFVDVVNNPSRQTPLIQEALMTSIVIDGGYRSATESGRWVDLNAATELFPPKSPSMAD